MSFKFTIEGTSLEVQTVAEAAELIRAYKAANTSPHPRQSNSGEGLKWSPIRLSTGAFIAPAGANEWTRNFLLEIRDSPAGSATTEQIAHALKVEHPKGIGGKLAIVNRVIESTGFKPHDTYSNTKTPEGRVWKPRPRINVVIEALEQRGGQ